MGKQIHFIQHEIDLYYTAIFFPQTSVGLALKDHSCHGPLQSWYRNHAGAWVGLVHHISWTISCQCQ